ncbi:MAG: FKBP-type peptidyl-prolyl cis-trans isomerase [Gammaproteobacteria bacterium]
MKQQKIVTIRRACAACLLIAASPIVGAQAPSPAPTPDATAPPATLSGEQSSYLFGLTFGAQMHGVGISDQVNLDAVTRGIHDGLQGKKSTPAEQQQLNVYVRSVMEAAVAHNQAAAKDFLDHNSHEKGVITTASGLQYKVVLPGDSKAAAITPTDQVTVQYRGKLLDGTEFDSSYARGTPATFPVKGVIAGWQEALVLMKPGAKWQLFVPPELAYGASPKPGIPGGSLLIFDVELVSVKADEQPKALSPAPDHKVKPKAK